MMNRLQKLAEKFGANSVLALTLKGKGILIEQIRRRNGDSLITYSTFLGMQQSLLLENPGDAGLRLRECLNVSKLRDKQVVVCFPPSWLMTSQLNELPAVEDEELEDYFALHAEKKFPVAPADLTFANSIYNDNSSGDRKSTLAALPSKYSEAISAMIESAGCKLESMSPGLNRCLVPKTSSKPSAQIHFLCHERSVDVVISNQLGIILLRSLSVPVSPGGQNQFDPAWFYQEVRMTLGRLPANSGVKVSEAIFCSENSFSEPVVQQVKNDLQRLGIQTVSFVKDQTAFQTADAFLHKRPVIFEFVVSELSQFEGVIRWFESGHRRWYLLSGLVFLLLPLTIFALQSHEENNLLAEWNSMKTTVTQLEQLQGKLRQFRTWYDPGCPSVRILDGLVNIFPDRGDVWAKQVNIKGNSKVVCEGFAKRQPAMLEFLERLRGRPEISELQVQQIRGENPIQFSFTFVWRQKDES